MNRIVLFLVLFFLPLMALAQADVLMSPEQLAIAGNGKIQLSPKIAQVNNGGFLFSDKKSLYMLMERGVLTLSKPSTKPIYSFSESDGAIVSIIDRNLCILDTLYHWSPISSLPSTNMDLSVGYSAIYLYDTKPVRKKYSVYVLRKYDLKAVKLFESTEPITSMEEKDAVLLYSTQKNIYAVELQSGHRIHLYNHSGKDPIQSIIWDDNHGVLFFSTRSSIYKIAYSDDEKPRAFCLTDNAGGYLCPDQKGLVLFLPEKRLLIRIRNEILFSE